MDYIEQVKNTLFENLKENYKFHCEAAEENHHRVYTYEEFVNSFFNTRINCGGYALEVYARIIPGRYSFEKSVSNLLDLFPFIRLLGNTELLDDEYIVKYRKNGDSLEHHFIKSKDGKITEKNEAEKIHDFEEWPTFLKNAPEAVFAVKKDHDMLLEKYNTFLLINGKDFEETGTKAYENKQNSFFYHCQEYFFKQDSQTNSIFIYSKINDELIKIGELKFDGDKCIPTIDAGYEDYVSNTKTNYTIGKEEKKNAGNKIGNDSRPI